MSIERIVLPVSQGGAGPDPEKEAPPAEQIDSLLTQFPEELQNRWEEEIEGMDDADALSLLRAALDKRMQMRRPTPPPGESAPSDEAMQMALGLRDEIMAAPHILGSGKVADVMADPTNADVCYKVVRDRDQYALCNGVIKESGFLDELADFSYAGVRTPRPYNTVVAPEFIAIGMERLPGLSLEEMLRLPQLPENFAIDEYVKAMETYLGALLAEHHVYHRDLRPGNMMFDPATGNAYLIDFGRSVHAYPDEKGFLEFTFQNRTVRVKNGDKDRLAYIQSLFKDREQAQLHNN